MSEASVVSVGWDDILPSSAPARRRVTTRRVLIAAAVALAAASVGCLIWLLTYDPLHEGSFGSGPEASSTLTFSRIDPGTGDIVYYVSSGEPGVFDIGYDVENEGRFPVTIQGLGSPSAFSLVGMTRHPTFEDPATLTFGRLVPFEPVTIEPGQSRFLVLRLEIEGSSVCTVPGGFGEPSDPSLRFRTFGIVPAETTVPLRFSIVTVCGDESSLPPSYDAFGR